MNLDLNERAYRLVEAMLTRASDLRIQAHHLATGARILDCGVKAQGGLHAGLWLARTCLADLADVSIVPGNIGDWTCPHVQVCTDHAVPACMASQYAGWQISVGKYFAMGSGPMRAAAGREELFDRIGFREQSPVAVGVLESRRLPDDEVVAWVCERARVSPSGLSLLIAPTASQAGGIQIVARSVETALHKLHELGFDLARIVSAHGIAPLPPVAQDDLAAIGRTNDAILYGARVTLWIRGDDAAVDSIGSRVPSISSPAHGDPFHEIFERAGRDFYQIDPHLFSPAEISFCNLDTGRVARFGKVEPDVLRRSFGLSE